MHRKWNIQAAWLAFLLALFMMMGSVNPVVLAAEEPAADTEAQQPVEETIPEEHIFLEWDVDSSLTYRLDEDNYVWTLFDENDAPLQNGSGVPHSAGYRLTGIGDWFGTAVVRLTITNNLPVDAKLQLMFRDALSPSASEIIGTLETQNEGVSRDASGVLTIKPEAVGVVSFTITAELLQKLNVTITEESNVVGWVQVQVLDPTGAPESISEETGEETTGETTEETTGGTTEETTGGTTEETTGGTTEETTGETTEETTGGTTEETTGETTEETTGGTTEGTTGGTTEGTTGGTTEETTGETTEETTGETTEETTGNVTEETTSEDQIVEQ